MHVFELDGPGEGAVLDGAGNLVEASEDRVPLLGAEHPLLGEHSGVGPGPCDVVARQALIKAYGGGEALHEGIRGLRKTATPKFPAAFAHGCSFLTVPKAQV